MKIPKLVYEDTTPEAFAAECRKYVGVQEPDFPLWSLVNVQGDWGRVQPAMVIGFECRKTGEWTYHLLRPRHYDGALERVVASRKDVSSLDASKT